MGSSSSSSSSFALRSVRISLLVVALVLFQWSSNPNPRSVAFVACEVEDRVEDGALPSKYSIVSSYDGVFGRDYSPPSPPPPMPPNPTVSSCEEDLDGIGSFDTLCQLRSSLELSGDVYVTGKGSFEILEGIVLSCPVAGCSLMFNLSGHIRFLNGSVVVSGSVYLVAKNVSIEETALVNSTALGGDPPPQTSGVPHGTHGDGGGYGGRGASCYRREGQQPDDSWGGDAYGWAWLMFPFSYGSKGGTTSRENDYGGGAGGRILINATDTLELPGTLCADGGDGGLYGGGGSGGSIYLTANKMKGNGKISASGGSGVAGGGGGRVSVKVFSRHDEQKIFVHGGRSNSCPSNNGAAGTLYDTTPQSLTVNNYDLPTETDTLLMEFPNKPLWTNVFVKNNAKVVVPLLWSRVQVQGQLSISGGAMLSFGLSRYPYSEFELMAEELLVSDSIIRVFGALRMSIKMLLMWNSKMLIDGGGDAIVATSLLEASNLIVLKGASVIHSNANLGVHGQGLLNLSGPGDMIEAQRLILSLFYTVHVGPGSVLRGPLENATGDDMAPKLNCDVEECPMELFHPPEDCNMNSSLSFTLQICRVEDISVGGTMQGNVIHFHRARSIIVQSTGTITASGLGCKGGTGQGRILDNGLGGGGGHGGKGGDGSFLGTIAGGGVAYGNDNLPCELGSGSGNDSFGASTAGGGIIVMGSMEHSLSSLSVHGSIAADGESNGNSIRKHGNLTGNSSGGTGGGSGGTILLFLQALTLDDNAIISSVGGYGSPNGGGGGGGGRVHFHWASISAGDEYLPVANAKGNLSTRGGLGHGHGFPGEDGSITGKDCPKGLFGIFCKECPLGTYKNISGSDKALCYPCPSYELPHRAVYTSVRGGVAERPCPYRCTSSRYHMPHCYTTIEELIYTFGGPWLFGLLLVGLLIFLALVLSVARMKFIGTDELPCPSSTQHESQIDHSFPFLESLNEVLETNRAEESQSHVHRMYFMGPNTFSEPWHLPYSPPAQIKEIVYEDAFNRFVEEINSLASYQWWEGALYSILSILSYPLAWSWQQWRRRKKLQRLREFVRSEYDHSCLRSCRSRALYEGLKVAATPDLMLAYVDFFLGGDEKRHDLPPRLHRRFPVSLIFGGDGSYMAPFVLHSDNLLTNLMSQVVAPTIWYRLVAGLNAQLRLVRRGHLKSKFLPVVNWLRNYANPVLSTQGVTVNLAWFQPTTLGYCQFGILVSNAEGCSMVMDRDGAAEVSKFEPLPRSIYDNGRDRFPDHLGINETTSVHKRIIGGILDAYSLRSLEDRKDISYPFTFILYHTKPIGHQDLVGLVISIMLLADFSLVLLTLLQLYSFSLGDVFLVLFVLPLGILSPFPAGINALFSHGPRKSAGLARVYALWNTTSLVNVVVAFICGFVHYMTQPSSNKKPVDFQPWNWSMDDSGWWLFPSVLLVCKWIQARLIDWHVANLEIQDRSLYSNDPDLFWRS